MKLNIRKAKAEKWFDYTEGECSARFQVRAFPFSQFRASTTEITEHLWHQFDYCLLAWEGLSDEDDHPLEMTADNKKLVFDYFEQIREFVMKCARDMAEDIGEELKNS